MNVQEPVPKRDLAGHDSKPGGVAACEILAELPRETVLLIHGTFANEPASWWLPSSEVCQKLDSALLQRKSLARCWTHVGTRKVFAWTGRNLEAERRIGGDRLAREIADLESITDIHRYHIVAHSHGGNVVLHALRLLAEDPKKLGAVIFLGTPVLCFSRLPSWLNRSGLAMLLYGSGLVLSIVAAWLGGESLSSVRLSEGSFLYAWYEGLPYPWFSLMTIGFVLLLLFECVEWFTRPGRQSPIYGSGHAHAFEFVPDEAMKALQLSLAIAQRPGEVLKQLYSTNTPYEYAVEPPRPEFWKGLWSDFKTTAPYRLFEASGFPSSFGQVARSKDLAPKLAVIIAVIVVAPLLLSLFLFPLDAVISAYYLKNGAYYIHNEKPFLFELVLRVRSMSKTVSNAEGIPVLGLCALFLIAMFFWRFLFVVFKFARARLACVVQLFLQGPGVRIMGLVVRNAAFGGQCKQVLGPQELPENERARCEAISDELHQKMNNLSKNTAARAGEALYFALAEGDAMQLKKHILARLTDPQLVHCQYYCEEEIISRIAELIAAPASDHPRESAC